MPLLYIIGNPLLGLTAFIGLRYADPLIERLGSIGKNVLVRLMGLILAAIAAQFVIDGLSDVLTTILRQT